jgi:phosphatidylethanolamine-binding protein (PEBP) family uncharacterized protein
MDGQEADFRRALLMVNSRRPTRRIIGRIAACHNLLGISAKASGLPEGAALAAPAAFTVGKNSLGMPYLGPCPPRGNATQHCVCTLIATSLEAGALPPGLDKTAVLDALKGGKALGAASLVLRFNH